MTWHQHNVLSALPALLLLGCGTVSERYTAPPVGHTEPATSDRLADGAHPRTTVSRPRIPDPVLSAHYIIIGQPVGHVAVDCAIFGKPQAPHNLPRQQLSDATDHPDRLSVPIALLEAVQNPSEVPLKQAQHSLLPDPQTPSANVAFALGPRAFRTEYAQTDAAYDRAYCDRLNALLGSKFLVLQAYPISVDWGLSSRDAWRETWGALGTDPGKAGRGFETLAQAEAYATTLVPGSVAEP